MRACVVDYETYWANDYTLSKMSTEAYVTDPRFQIILVGIHFADAEPEWFSGSTQEVTDWLDAKGVFDAFVIAHNGFFDFLVMAVHHKRLPKMMCCTLKMASAVLRPLMPSLSLGNCLEAVNAPINKGDMALRMKGRPLQSMSKQELREYAGYCMDDCAGTLFLFKSLAPQFPPNEFRTIDLTLRMYLEPQLELDANILAENLAQVRATKAQQMAALPPSVTEASLRSNPKFAQVLESFGIVPPMKVSPTTQEETYAFAKTDPGWKELEEDWGDHPIVGPILVARIGAKSTMEEARSERLLEIAKTTPKFRVPLWYYGAHTGRYGGREKINPQNFPRIDKSRMRFAIRAPKGHVVLAADLSQIEARITAWLAKCLQLMDGFRAGLDLYIEFAQQVFREEVIKDRSALDKMRRFVGKTCILGLGFGMGGLVLRVTLRKSGLKFTLQQTTDMVHLYRDRYHEIPSLWRQFDNAIPFIAGGGGQLKIGPVTVGQNVIVLPNGMSLQYPKCGIRKDKEGRNKWSYVYGNELRWLWGGTLTENVVQALAQILIKDHALTIKRELGLRPALQQHDELDYVVPVSEAESCARLIEPIMCAPPLWAPDLPVAVEINYGKTLGDCK